MSPTTPNAQQVSSFETQQQLQAQHDADERQQQQELAAAMQQLQQEQGVPGPEADRHAADDSRPARCHLRRQPNAPQHTSNVSEAQAEAKQKASGDRKAAAGRTQQRHRRHRLLSMRALLSHRRRRRPLRRRLLAQPAARLPQESVKRCSKSRQAAEPDGCLSDFDQYQGRLYRVFEGTVLEGVVTNHIDGGSQRPDPRHADDGLLLPRSPATSYAARARA